jgi:hypothetical protein
MTRMLRRLARRCLVVVAGIVLSFAVVSGAARAGGRYFYCDAMGMLQWDPCAQGASHRDGDDPADRVAPHHVDCCEVGTLPSFPDGSGVATPTVSPPPLTAVVPAAALAGGHAPRLVLSRSAMTALEHWRGPPRSPAERRAELMVFLT